ncbi:hypothetical protein [Nocardia mexicana]|uniref:DUF402 domain-containing protein n=1 Tax=Nocardia mexicana TaxID=279262 RepID=A0A370H3D6_9NOCA|nr:hypothetical protein [Nocardia mexicana]RDI49682.1 hypothetical protein DFR68_106117 [Nocardia mexicana]
MAVLPALRVTRPAVTDTAERTVRGPRSTREGFTEHNGVAAIQTSNSRPDPHPDADGSTPAHRPHVEYFDLADLTLTDPRGFVHPVERYHAEPWGLYLMRAADAPPNRYTETWLLPKLAIRVGMQHVNAAHDRDPHYHIRLGEYARIEPKRWAAYDHYIDLVARNGRPTEMHGIAELLAAHAADCIDAAQAQHIIEHANAVADGIAAHGRNVERWLRSHGITLTWL